MRIARTHAAAQRVAWLLAAALASTARPGWAADEPQPADAAPIPSARLVPSIWDAQQPVVIAPGTPPLAVFALRLGGLTDQQADRLASDVEKLAPPPATLAIVDASDGALLLDDAATDPTARRVALYRAIRQQHARLGDSAAVNLPRTLQTMADVTHAYTGRMSATDYYLVGAMQSNSDGFDFASGYPNDGFLLLNDTPFHFVTPAPAPGSKFHVMGMPETPQREAFERFAALLAQQIFNASLATFSTAMVKGELPPFTLTPPDRTVTASTVLRPDVRPACPYEDIVKAADAADFHVSLDVTNLCRHDAIVNLIVNGVSQTLPADGKGTVHFQPRLTVGRNQFTLIGLDGKPRTVFERDVPPVDDAITLVPTNEGVSLNGSNPLRPDDSIVHITEPASGREWTSRVNNGRWSLSIPMAPGRHMFQLDRVGNSGEQSVYHYRPGAGSDFDRVADQKGNTGPVQLVLAWDDRNDLDLVVKCPDGSLLYFNKKENCGGRLDVDANVGPNLRSDPAENIAWAAQPAPGTYQVYVKFYKQNDKPASPYRMHIFNGTKTVELRGIATAKDKSNLGPLVYSFTIK